MEHHGQNNSPLGYNPAAGPEQEITAITTAPVQQETLHKESEKVIASLAPDYFDPIAAVDVLALAAPPLVIPLEQLNDAPKLVDCPFCKYRAMTKVTEENSTQTGIAALFCCLFCGIIGVCVPYICKWAQDYHHFCTHCGAKVAIRPNDGPVQVQKPSGPASMPSAYPAAPSAPPKPA
ncbi:hypothetical protein UA08_01246 [Talaromyces atroroseus]|uniref:LITAF domain-containing protein n=1 Tax=Talaromyces atroroseus TaxID=1441469 RepID=A0A1Q5Q9L5_TALAT|nr:hypothetical protein UA08_01246 [Talaromyces atroroseus]OKL62623.1 hypothetical protein UA08_01246 [Talaromyces atroroseus]